MISKPFLVGNIERRGRGRARSLNRLATRAGSRIALCALWRFPRATRGGLRQLAQEAAATAARVLAQVAFPASAGSGAKNGVDT